MPGMKRDCAGAGSYIGSCRWRLLRLQRLKDTAQWEDNVVQAGLWSGIFHTVLSGMGKENTYGTDLEVALLTKVFKKHLWKKKRRLKLTAPFIDDKEENSSISFINLLYTQTSHFKILNINTGNNSLQQGFVDENGSDRNATEDESSFTDDL